MPWCFGPNEQSTIVHKVQLPDNWKLSLVLRKFPTDFVLSLILSSLQVLSQYIQDTMLSPTVPFILHLPPRPPLTPFPSAVLEALASLPLLFFIYPTLKPRS